MQHQTKLSQMADAIAVLDTSGVDVRDSVAVANAYAGTHMDVATTIMLQGSYNRALSAANTPVAAAGSGAVYAAAQAACGGHADSITQARCVSNYVATHAAPGSNAPTSQLAPPNKADYTVTFKGPAWSFDDVGMLLLGAFGLLVAAIILSLRRPGGRLT